MRLGIVLDTNVLVSGLLFTGPPHQLLSLVLSGTAELIASPILLNELERVLRLKFPQHLQAIHDTLQSVTERATLVFPTEQLTVISEDPSGNRILECALAGRADVIISGDRHLLVLKTFRGIPIHSPHDFLAECFKRGLLP